MNSPTLKRTTLVLACLFPVSLGNAMAGDDAPITATPVSPGTREVGALIGDPCPSFSWGAVAGAQRYELAIFDAQWQDSPAYAEQQRQGAQLRQIEIAAPALSWTPAGSDCLEEGGTYLWFVRAQSADGDGQWSEPRYFEIDYDADALTQTVRRELAAQLRQPEVWRDVIQAALATNSSLRLTPLASAALLPPAMVDKVPRAAGTGMASAEENADISPQAATFPNPAALKINSPNGVVFHHSVLGGGIPAEGVGTRFMWYPGKAALRAGKVYGSQWDDVNIGVYSTAMGSDTTASGNWSTAMGVATTANGHATTAMGYYTDASGDYSTAMGIYTTASGRNSTAMGDTSIASGLISTAMGYHATASGYNSIATGNYTTASGSVSTALGINTIASGDYSVAMGEGVTAASGYEIAIGRYNLLYTPASATGWEDKDLLFVIGNGTSDAPRGRRNALVVLKNGNVGIGTSAPEFSLHLLNDSAAKPGTNTWTIASDARLKAITGPYESGLAEIAALQPVRYHYAAGNARGHDPTPEYVGFIAQQAQAVFPEAVSEGADGYLDFNMHAVNVAMVNAIQTLREQNLALEVQLKAQGDELQTMREESQAQVARMQELRAENAALVQSHAAQEQRLVTLEAENAHHARLQADLAQLQAQVQVLQGQMAGDTSHAQVALGQ